MERMREAISFRLFFDLMAMGMQITPEGPCFAASSLHPFQSADGPHRILSRERTPELQETGIESREAVRHFPSDWDTD